jgi:hypothetical protein
MSFNVHLKTGHGEARSNEAIQLIRLDRHARLAMTVLL